MKDEYPIQGVGDRYLEPPGLIEGGVSYFMTNFVSDTISWPDIHLGHDI